MAQLIFITGGSRSGKSRFAQQLAESLPGPRVFLATCPALDDEMRTRIQKHRLARRAGHWRTVEETIDLPAVILRETKAQVILIDCLTLWINNLMHEAELSGRAITEQTVTRHCRALLAAGRKHPGTILFVTNETGMGIIPDTAVCRLYRDLVGRCNQAVAQACDRAVLMVSGQPLELKKQT